MLLDECDRANVILQLETHIKTIEAFGSGYKVSVKAIDAVEAIECESLVIATGGLSIPKIGASRFGYDIAQQFGLKVTSLKPALVPLTFHSEFLDFLWDNLLQRRLVIYPSRSIWPVSVTNKLLLG